MKSVINRIEDFDFSRISDDDFKLFAKLNSLKIITHLIPSGTWISRCRKNTSFAEKFYFDKDLSYRTDILNIKKFGRCNYPRNSVFYGSIYSEEIEKPYIVSLFETSEFYRTKHNGIEMFTIGMWKTKSDMEVASIIPNINKNNSSPINKITIDNQNKFMLDNNFNQDDILFYDLLGKEFTKCNDNKSHFNYFLSANFSHTVLSLPEINGLIYPSVQTEYKGFNLVIKPSSVDKYLDFDSAILGLFIIIDDFSTFTPLYFADSKKSSPFIWEESKPYYNTKRIIDFLESNNIKDRVLNEVLLNQIFKMKF